jgi:uncharacterized protein (TIGR02284 family)
MQFLFFIELNSSLNPDYMRNNDSLIEVLNDLVRINNDRITGYEKAAEEVDIENEDLKTIFHKMANDSRENVKELSQLIEKSGADVSQETTLPGNIFRAWMDIKAAFTGSRKSILSLCEYGEDAAQKAYEEVLSSDAEIDTESRQLIMSQKSLLRESHNIIKKYRDMHEPVS